MECRRCKKDLDEDNFPSNGAGGIRHQCKECMREINQKWRRSNKPKVAEYNKNRPTKIKPAQCAAQCLEKKNNQDVSIGSHDTSEHLPDQQ